MLSEKRALTTISHERTQCAEVYRSAASRMQSVMDLSVHEHASEVEYWKEVSNNAVELEVVEDEADGERACESGREAEGWEWVRWTSTDNWREG